MNELRIKRAYRAARISDGARILVDRVWPRGMTRERLRIAEWLKEIAPTADLRRWFNHDPAKWDDFRAAYFRELEGKQQEVSQILDLLEDGPVTLIYGAKEKTLNNAAALKEFLEATLRECEMAAAPDITGTRTILRPGASGEAQ